MVVSSNENAQSSRALVPTGGFLPVHQSEHPNDAELRFYRMMQRLERMNEDAMLKDQELEEWDSVKSLGKIIAVLAVLSIPFWANIAYSFLTGMSAF